MALREIAQPKHVQEQVEELELARKLVELKEYDDAWRIVDLVLEDNPNHVPALIMGTSIHEKARRLSVAYQMAKRAVDLAPNLCAAWGNYGRLAELLYQLKDAEYANEEALKRAKNDRQASMYHNNMSALLTLQARWVDGEKRARKALALDPENRKAKGNLGLALLGQRKWKEGWENYDKIIGLEQRKLVKYAEEDTWDGTHGQTVVVYGEQGLGDELSFASMLPDVIRDCRRVIVDCDHRLEGIFKRSFPEATIYGTRWDKQVEWREEDREFDASISIGQLGALYRLKDEDFPGTAYLKPDPDRVRMWKALFETKRKPVIGIAWTGGLQFTGAKYRKWKLEQLAPLFGAVDAHWVSLQWKDAAEEMAKCKDAGLAEIHQYKWATLSKDYDDTAALVAASDLVICMQTSVGHLAASMGKEVWVFVSKLSQWRYSGQGDTIPWYKSMRVWRQRQNLEWPIEEAARVLAVRYGLRAA